MYHFTHDRQHAYYVARFAAGGDMQADFGQHLEHLGVALQQAKEDGQRLSLVILFEAGHDVPDAGWRAKVAEFQKRDIFTPQVVVVSGNPLLRAVMTAIDWLRGSTMGVQTTAAGEQAAPLLEASRGRAIPGLRQAVQQVASL